jgi:hypothetical protein
MYTYALMALISAAISVRDHKQYFQFATNTHERLSMIVFFANLAMIALSVPLIWRFGLYGFQCVWLASEVTQMGLIYRENRKLFDRHASITLIPVVKLVAVLVVSLPVCMTLLHFASPLPLWMMSAVAAAGVVLLMVESYFVFRLRDIWTEFGPRIRASVRTV